MISFADLFAQGANFILGICVLLGAAFVNLRSHRAALFVALGGLGYALSVPVELFLGRWGFHMARGTGLQFLFFVVSVARHVVLFGGVAMGMRTLAQESA